MVSKAGWGSFFTLDLGEKLLRTRRNGTQVTRGSFHVWVQCAHWVLTRNVRVLLTESSIDAQNQDQLAGINGRKIRACTMDAETMELRVVFDGGYEISVRPYL